MKSSKKRLPDLTLSAMFLALGLVLPMITGVIPKIGNMLLPMHIPVLLCGLVCGWQYGAVVGFVTPLLRNLIFAMPPMPNALSMAFELATYGLVIGIVYSLIKKKNIASVYISMIISMLSGRAVWGVAQAVIMGIKGTGFTFKAFLAGAFVTAVPGIVIQLVLIPAVMVVLDKTGAVRFAEKQKSEDAK